MLDQLPSANTEARLAPAFCRKKAAIVRMSLADEEGEETLIIDFIQLAIVSMAAGV